jgi:hypothetical protein
MRRVSCLSSRLQSYLTYLVGSPRTLVAARTTVGLLKWEVGRAQQHPGLIPSTVAWAMSCIARIAPRYAQRAMRQSVVSCYLVDLPIWSMSRRRIVDARLASHCGAWPTSALCQIKRCRRKHVRDSCPTGTRKLAPFLTQIIEGPPAFRQIAFHMNARLGS